MRKTLKLLFSAAVLVMLLFACTAAQALKVYAADWPVTENGRYTSKEEVAVYLDTYGKLPCNYITKRDAQNLGWDSRSGNLWKVTDHCSIGGDRFGNYEGLLPTAKGRRYTECDIDFEGRYRNGKRIIFSNDGLIYYTEDHYESFEEVEVVPAPAETPAKTPAKSTKKGAAKKK